MGDLFDRGAFGDKVRAAVSDAGSYRKAALQCRVSPGALHKIAEGAMLPSVEIFFRLKRWIDGELPSQ